MKGLFDQTKLAVWLLGVGAGVTIWAFTTFATIRYVDDKHAEVTEKVDLLSSDQADMKAMLIDLYRDRFRRDPVLPSEMRLHSSRSKGR